MTKKTIKKVREFRIRELTYRLKVEQAMTRDVISVHPRDRMSDLREIMRVNRISGTPVVDQDELVGIVSIEDFIKCLADNDVDAFVEQKMTKQVDTVYADEPLAQAVDKFNRQKFGRFPVIDRTDGKLVGIITKDDLIRALLEELQTDYLEEETARYRASHKFEDIIADRTTVIFEYDIVGQDFQRAGAAASGLKKNLARFGIPPQILRRVAIATYEAEMNIVIYTTGGNITAYVRADQVALKIEDSGPGIADLKQAMQPGFSTAPPSVQELGFGAGMGMPNIKKCADELKIDSKIGKGTKLELVIYMEEENDT